MRIIRGLHRGRQIFPPKNLPVRPTTDFAKEALFNILEHQYDFTDLEILDLFAGTGSISYEFASRDCRIVTAVDSHQGCVTFIAETAKKLDFKNIKVFRSDVFKFLKQNKKPYHLVFADPPFNFEDLKMLPSLVLNKNILTNEGLFILEHPGSYDFSEHEFFTEHRNYGSVHFSFFTFLLR